MCVLERISQMQIYTNCEGCTPYPARVPVPTIYGVLVIRIPGTAEGIGDNLTPASRALALLARGNMSLSFCSHAE